MNTKLIVISICSFLIAACNLNENGKGVQDGHQSNDYATYFQLEELENGYRILSVNENWSGNKITKSFLLQSKGTKSTGNIPDHIQIIQTPVKKVVCMSTSHIAYLSLLGEVESLKAISGAQYVSDSLVASKIKNNQILDIGFESSLNYEMLMQIDPDIVFTYGISGENNQYIKKIIDAGINVVVVGDYMEGDPLGKLEYLKFFGAFFDKKEIADSLYKTISNRYSEAQQRVADIKEKPVILLNAPWKDVWYIPGKNNYMSHLIEDAAGEVLLSKPGDIHSYAHSLENVVTMAYEADLWLNPNFYQTLDQLMQSNPLFKELPVLKRGKVFNNIKRDTPGGGSDFWESGVVRPDVILNDLINIIHPECGNKKELVYYKLLE
ncbi:MAG: hypothetical protein EOM16_00545 [Bacteroidia bacterium]|jgi:iron complex transport system substrate-binding protein|nr:hypothetical protein [Bacteroidia bacterium]